MNPETIANILPCGPPFVWPEPRFHAGQAYYEPKPPFEPLLPKADLVAGVLVGVEDGTIQWLRRLMEPTTNLIDDMLKDAAESGVTGIDDAIRGLNELFGGPEPNQARSVRLVVLVYPAGPTHEAHLLALKMLQSSIPDEQGKLEIRLLPTQRLLSDSCEKMVLPPNLVLAHDSREGKALLCIGSVGDSGHDEIGLSSFNAVIQPDAAFCDHWRRWFQYLFDCAVPLTDDTVRIPALVPAQGDPAAAALWAQYEQIVREGHSEGENRPTVDPETGEVTKKSDGSKTEPWDGGKIQLDPLAQILQKVYADGCLATVDETTRIKPLSIPVKATLLGEKTERQVGSVTQKQSFSLAVLDKDVANEIEKCRKVADISNLLGYQLSLGNRWVSNAGKALLDRELKARNEQGKARLKETLGSVEDTQDRIEDASSSTAAEEASASNGVKEYIDRRKSMLKGDLDAMYRELGGNIEVPPDKFGEVLEKVEARLTAALDDQISPRMNYNQVLPPNLTHDAPDEQWSQPLTLLVQSARLLRVSLTDAFFSRNFKKRSFAQQEFENAMNVFSDTILKTRDKNRAETELATLDEIEQSEKNNKEKCHAVWELIKQSITDPLNESDPFSLC